MYYASEHAWILANIILNALKPPNFLPQHEAAKPSLGLSSYVRKKVRKSSRREKTDGIPKRFEVLSSSLRSTF